MAKESKLASSVLNDLCSLWSSLECTVSSRQSLPGTRWAKTSLKKVPEVFRALTLRASVWRSTRLCLREMEPLCGLSRSGMPLETCRPSQTAQTRWRWNTQVSDRLLPLSSAMFQHSYQIQITDQSTSSSPSDLLCVMAAHVTTQPQTQHQDGLDMLLLLIAPAGAAITFQCSVQGSQGYSALMYGHCFSLHCSCKAEPPALESVDCRRHVSFFERCLHMQVRLSVPFRGRSGAAAHCCATTFPRR